jgi:hypothetical protein
MDATPAAPAGVSGRDLAHLKAGCKLYAGQIDDTWFWNGLQPAVEPHVHATYDFKSKQFWYDVDGVLLTSGNWTPGWPVSQGHVVHSDGNSFVYWWGSRDDGHVEAIAARHGLTLHGSTTAW